MKNANAPQRKLVILGSARRLTKGDPQGDTPELVISGRYYAG